MEAEKTQFVDGQPRIKVERESSISSLSSFEGSQPEEKRKKLTARKEYSGLAKLRRKKEIERRREMFNRAQQGTFETTTEWKDRVQELYLKAHPGSDPKAVNSDLTEVYSFGLSDPLIRRRTCKAEPQQLGEAYIISRILLAEGRAPDVRESEVVLEQGRADYCNQWDEREERGRSQDHTPIDGYQNRTSTEKRQSRKREKKPVDRNQTTMDRENLERSNYTQYTCFACGERGHIASWCQTRYQEGRNHQSFWWRTNPAGEH